MESGERLLTADPKSVISRYQRLLYAPDSKVSAIRTEIRDFDRQWAAAGEEPASATPSPAPAATTAPEDFGHFDPNLKPTSTVEYEKRGAVIENPRILAPDGSQVNVLRSGQTYTYTYDVAFLEPAFGVRFGMLVKLMTGFELGGQVSHAPGEAIAYIEAGSTARVRFSIQALLMHGVYFLNAGVVAFRDGGEVYLHRILDAVMFRIPEDEPSVVTTHVDLRGAAAAEFVIEPPPKAELK
jgi:lipopolysaccharide transport system ATP-binding protein